MRGKRFRKSPNKETLKISPLLRNYLGHLLRVPHGLLVDFPTRTIRTSTSSALLAALALLPKEANGNHAEVKVRRQEVEPEDDASLHRRPTVAASLWGKNEQVNISE